jgi:hypothetical protein
MKRAFRISILIILLFAVVVKITAKEERSIDGNNVYGFPLMFYTEYSMEVIGPVTPPYFSFLNLIVDLLPVTVLAIFVERAVAAIVEKVKTKSATK